jgi:ribosomal protein L11 methyltransferase
VSEPLYQVTALCQRDAVDEAFMAGIDHRGVLSSSLFGEGAEVEWRSYCETRADAEAFALYLRSRFGLVASVEPVPDENWVALTQSGLVPIIAGRFRVHGGHDSAEDGYLNILIEAGEAFGTGHHGTTAGCLAAIDRLIDAQSITTCMDIGTGSGVLAIAVAKAAQIVVVANDIDPIAVEVTIENARLNGVEGLIHAEFGDGASERAARGETFDLILANILTGPLIDIAPEIRGLCHRHSRVVLSGLLDAHQVQVIAAYVATGMTLIEASVLEGWATLVLGVAES